MSLTDSGKPSFWMAPPGAVRKTRSPSFEKVRTPAETKTPLPDGVADRAAEGHAARRAEERFRRVLRVHVEVADLGLDGELTGGAQGRAEAASSAAAESRRLTLGAHVEPVARQGRRGLDEAVAVGVVAAAGRGAAQPLRGLLERRAHGGDVREALREEQRRRGRHVRRRHAGALRPQ